MAAPIDLKGQRFGKLVVLTEATKKAGWDEHRIHWLCRCDCGRTKIVVGKRLRNGDTKSCGCWGAEATRLNRRKEPGRSGFVELWHSYRLNAAERGYAFTLDQETFQKLTSALCAYCGAPPEKIRYMRGRKMTEEGVKHSTYRFNGVDRIDNARGYEPDNCVPCCETCNYAKRKLTTAQFLAWARRVVEYQDRT